MDEAQTRREIIDRNLALAGWNVDDPSHVTQELDIDLSAAGRPKAKMPDDPHTGHQFADYGLLLHGVPVAVVEAKKTSKDAALGREQARLAPTVQEQIRAPEQKKRRLRQRIFDVEDEIAEKRDRLIEALERRMRQKTETRPLFTIQWAVR